MGVPDSKQWQDDSINARLYERSLLRFIVVACFYNTVEVGSILNRNLCYKNESCISNLTWQNENEPYDSNSFLCVLAHYSMYTC